MYQLKPNAINIKDLEHLSGAAVFEALSQYMLDNKEIFQLSKECSYKYEHVFFEEPKSQDVAGSKFQVVELSCVAGSLFKENQYKEQMEGHDWFELVKDGYVSSAHKEIIFKLQYIFDTTDVDNWEAEINELKHLLTEKGLL